MALPGPRLLATRRAEADADLAKLIAAFGKTLLHDSARSVNIVVTKTALFEWLERPYAARDPALTEMKRNPRSETWSRIREARYASISEAILPVAGS